MGVIVEHQCRMTWTMKKMKMDLHPLTLHLAFLLLLLVVVLVVVEVVVVVQATRH